MTQVRLIKMCLNETYSEVRIGKHLSDTFSVQNGLKQGDALAPLLINFALEYTIRKLQEIQLRLKFNGTRRVVVYAGNVLRCPMSNVGFHLLCTSPFAVISFKVETVTAI
jgi:hypothetical protein